MKKINKIVLLLIGLIFLSTYSPNKTILSKQKIDLFKIKNIEIKNNLLIKKSEIEGNLKHIYNKNIFLIKSKDIRSSLEKIDFMKKIEVKKKYPDAIIVTVYETKPIAIINIKDNKFLLDSSFEILSIKDNVNYDKLPNIFGEDTVQSFKYFYSILKKNNFPIKKVKNFYFFQSERWDIQFLNNKTIKYPYKDLDLAIKTSIELINRNDFANYNIIDLRMHDKVVVE
jgi:cell division septal protein FtsQ